MEREIATDVVWPERLPGSVRYMISVDGLCVKRGVIHAVQTTTQGNELVTRQAKKYERRVLDHKPSIWRRIFNKES